MASSSQSSPISNFIDYFTNIKPYHSKILEVVQKYNFYDDVIVDCTDSISRKLSLANTPLCKGVGFGYIWDDCCGFDATDCCTLGKCPTDESNYQNLTAVYHYPIISVSALEGEVTIAGDYTYDKTFQIKKIFSDTILSVTGDVTDLLGREPTFTIIPYNTIQFSLNGVNTITISGDKTKQLTDNKLFYVYGTGYNDGVHNVVSVIYNRPTNTTQIQVSGTLVPNKPGTILLKSPTKNAGFFTATSFVFNGTETNITLDSTHSLSLETVYPSIVFKTGLLQNRLIQISGNDAGNDGTWPISDIKYNPSTGNSTIILKNSLQAYTGAVGSLDLMLRLAPEDYKIDSGCTPAKEANVSVNFSETLVIQGLSSYFPSPTTTPTPTPTPTATTSITVSPSATPSSTVTPTATATPSPTPSVSISLSPTQTPTPTPTTTSTITPTPSVSSAALNAYLSDPTSSGTASASCGMQTVYSDAITAITEGGCGNYTWEWKLVSGDATIIPILANAQVTGFQKDTPSDGVTYTAVYRCKVTDSCSNVVYTDSVSIDITNNMGNCSALSFSVVDSDPGSSNYGQETSPTVLKSACTAGTGCFYPGSAYGLNPTTGLPEYYNISANGVLLPTSRQPQYCDGNTWVNIPGIKLVGGSGSYTITINNVNVTCTRYNNPTDHPYAIGIMVGGNGDKTSASDSLIIYPQDDGTFTTNKTELNVAYNGSLDVYGPIFVLVSSENVLSYQLKVMADVLISDTAGGTIATTLEIPVSRSADTSLGDYQC